MSPAPARCAFARSGAQRAKMKNPGIQKINRALCASGEGFRSARCAFARANAQRLRSLQRTFFDNRIADRSQQSERVRISQDFPEFPALKNRLSAKFRTGQMLTAGGWRTLGH